MRRGEGEAERIREREGEGSLIFFFLDFRVLSVKFGPTDKLKKIRELKIKC